MRKGRITSLNCYESAPLSRRGVILSLGVCLLCSCLPFMLFVKTFLSVWSGEHFHPSALDFSFLAGYFGGSARELFPHRLMPLFTWRLTVVGGVAHGTWKSVWGYSPVRFKGFWADTVHCCHPLRYELRVHFCQSSRMRGSSHSQHVIWGQQQLVWHEFTHMVRMPSFLSPVTLFCVCHSLPQSWREQPCVANDGVCTFCLPSKPDFLL